LNGINSIPGSGAGVRGLYGRGVKILADYFPIITILSNRFAYMVIITIMGKT
jgi:hypothetical protein